MLHFLIRTWRSDGKPPTVKWGARALISGGVAGTALVGQIAAWPIAYGDTEPSWLADLGRTTYTAAGFVGLVAMTSAFYCFLKAALAERRETRIDPNDTLVRAALEMADGELETAIAALHDREYQLLTQDRHDEARPIARDKFVLLSVRNSRRGSAWRPPRRH